MEPICFGVLRDDLHLRLRAGQLIEIDPDTGLDQYGERPNWGYLAGLLADGGIIPLCAFDRRRLAGLCQRPLRLIA